MAQPETAPTGITETYVPKAPLRKFVDRARAAGAEIIRGPESTDFGSRECTARDLEGHLWSFGTYRPSAED